jgi:hypothetical protein
MVKSFIEGDFLTFFYDEQMVVFSFTAFSYFSSYNSFSLCDYYFYIIGVSELNEEYFSLSQQFPIYIYYILKLFLNNI